MSSLFGLIKPSPCLYLNFPDPVLLLPNYWIHSFVVEDVIQLQSLLNLPKDLHLHFLLHSLLLFCDESYSSLRQDIHFRFVLDERNESLHQDLHLRFPLDERNASLNQDLDLRFPLDHPRQSRIVYSEIWILESSEFLSVQVRRDLRRVLSQRRSANNAI